MGKHKIIVMGGINDIGQIDLTGMSCFGGLQEDVGISIPKNLIDKTEHDFNWFNEQAI